jgi:uncharacterized protein YjbJ (UPF0337 family)
MMAIDAQKLQGQWNQLRGKVKEKWGQLTDDELQIHGGNIDQLVGRIQKKTGEGREAVEAFLAELTTQGSSAVGTAAETARGYARQAGDQVREGYDRAADYAHDRYQRARGMVRHQPAVSMMTAFAVGLGIGVAVGLALRAQRPANHPAGWLPSWSTDWLKA